MLREILQYPDTRLTKKADPVTIFDDSLQILIDDMIETMLHSNGIGLAAPQIGISLEAIVIAKSIIENIEKDEEYDEQESEILVVINPTITTNGDPLTYQEGCLSVPHYRENVTRPEHVLLQAFTTSGEPYSLEANGLLAVCIQHELDHLIGKLFIDRISFLKRSLYDAKIFKGKL
ncbi:MAG: peptide deformylase [Desulfovibrionaceae bacterium]